MDVSVYSRARRATVAALAATVLAVPALIGGLAAESASAAPNRGDRVQKDGPKAPDCGDAVARSGGGAWTCTFADDFGGRSLDTGKWVIGDTSMSGFSMNGTCFDPSDGNIRVRGGELHLTTRKTQPFQCRSPYGSFQSEYTGATISTYGKFQQTYGRFETRMSFPETPGAGVHGGFWMNPRERVYGAWPHSGEIDVAEWFSAIADRAYPSLHYAGDTAQDTGWNCVIGDPTAYHTYAVEWQPTKMDFYYDGRLCFSRSWVPDAPLVAPQPFDQPFVMALTNAVGAMWNAPDATTVLPATISVDYVRAWK